MKTEISISNGSGWNRYEALKELKTLQVGTRGLMAENGVKSIEIRPTDSERPYGFSAFYYDAYGNQIFRQGFDWNDSAGWVRQRVFSLLVEGIQNRINKRNAELNRAAFVKRISAWRRNFDAKPAAPTASGDRLRAKFAAMRKAGGCKISRKTCWNLTHAVIEGRTTYRAAAEVFTK